MLFKLKSKTEVAPIVPPVAPPVMASEASVLTATLQDLKAEFPGLYAEAVAEGVAQYKATEARASGIRAVCEKAGSDDAEAFIAGTDSVETIAYSLLMSAKPTPKTEFNKPVTHTSENDECDYKSFSEAVAAYRSTNKCSYSEGMKACAKKYPELYSKSTNNSIE